MRLDLHRAPLVVGATFLVCCHRGLQFTLCIHCDETIPDRIWVLRIVKGILVVDLTSTNVTAVD